MTLSDVGYFPFNYEQRQTDDKRCLHKPIQTRHHAISGSGDYRILQIGMDLFRVRDGIILPTIAGFDDTHKLFWMNRLSILLHSLLFPRRTR